MVRSSRRQTLLRTTSGGRTCGAVGRSGTRFFAPTCRRSRTADRRGRRRAEGRAPYRRRPPVLIQEMNLSLIILLPIANKFHKFHGPPTSNCPRNVKPVTSQKSHAISEVSRAINLQFLQERQPLPLAKSHTRPNVNLNQKTKFHQVRQAPAWSSKH